MVSAAATSHRGKVNTETGAGQGNDGMEAEKKIRSAGAEAEREAGRRSEIGGVGAEKGARAERKGEEAGAGSERGIGHGGRGP